MKFRIGDKVRCIEPKGNRIKGLGWIKGIIFTIKEITNEDENPILWSENELKNNCGVFAYDVEKVSGKLEKIKEELLNKVR